MKRLLISLILGIMASMPFLGMDKPHQGSLKPIMSKSYRTTSKLPALGALGLYGFVGWSAYSFIQNLELFQERALAKLYKKDFNALGVRYLDRLEFETPDLKKQNIQKTSFYKNNEEYLKKMEEQFGEPINNHHVAPIYLSYINKKIGHGAFADKKINPGQVVGEYTGIVRDNNKFNQHADLGIKYAYAFDFFSKNRVLDAYEGGNETRFINHSYEPNVDVEIVPANDQWHIAFVANKPIEENEQLFIDYGRGYWANRGEPDVALVQEYRFNKAYDALQNFIEHAV